MLRTLAILALSLAAASSSAQEASPDSVLKEKGLKRAGTTYILPAEAQFQKKINAARALYRAVSLAAERKQLFEANVAARQNDLRLMERQYVALNEELTQVSSNEERNRLVAMSNSLAGQINLHRQDADPENHQVPGARLAIQREEFIEAVIALRLFVDSSIQAYADLAKDAEVQKTLTDLNAKTKAKLNLGPTRAFLANVKLLEKVEASVLTEEVTLRKEGGVFWVDVTFNGKTTKPMIYDTGASSVVLPSELALELGLKPSPNDEVVKAHIADGSIVDARKAVLSSIRVGKFTVKDVECIVMPPSKTDVAPLLGQTFQRHFISKFSPDAARLVLSKIDTPEAAAPNPKDKTTKKPPKNKR